MRAQIHAKLPAFLIVFLMATVSARAQSCNAPTKDVVTTINLPGAPFSIIPTQDGCTIFVSMGLAQDQTAPGHIAVLRRTAGNVMLVRDVPISTQYGVVGMALSHDGKVLAAANLKGVLLLDVDRLAAGDGKPIAQARDKRGANPQALAGSISVAISPDDKLLFVSDESSTTLTEYDLAKLRAGSSDAIGQTTVGKYPVDAAFSPDGRKLYSISEEAQPGITRETCPDQNGFGGSTPQGLLTIVDVSRAATDPAGAVLAKVPAGCAPVRVALSKDGTRAFVTDRSVDTLLVFDTAKLETESDHALLGRVIVGKAPVGVVAVGQYVVVSDSNRLKPAGRKHEWLSVVDPISLKVIGNVPAGLFPRTLVVTADDKTLLVPNSNSNSLELVDLARLTPAYFAQQKAIKDADDAEQARFQAALEERIKDRQPAPGSEAALRHIIESLARGAPDYAALASDRANTLRISSAGFSARLQKFGALQSIVFKSANRNAVDTFAVTFEHAQTDWSICLSPDGKAVIFGLDAVK